MRDLFERDFVRGFIEFSKPLIALVNGPAVGISFTVLGLFDMVISSDKVNILLIFLIVICNLKYGTLVLRLILLHLLQNLLCHQKDAVHMFSQS